MPLLSFGSFWSECPPDIRYVSASFSADDGKAIAALKKGAKVSFVCQEIRETFGDGYSLGNCKMQ